MRDIFYLFSILILTLSSCSREQILFQFPNKSSLVYSESDVDYELKIISENDSLIANIRAIRIDISDGETSYSRFANYSKISKIKEGFITEAQIIISDSKISIHDIWSSENEVQMLKRIITVEGNSDEAFLSAIEFEFIGMYREDVDYFVPGMVYGSSENLTPDAIGGGNLYNKGNGKLWIREDRLPAPIFAFRFDENNSFSILDIKPDGRTSLADAHDIKGETIIDENLRFGALFAEHIFDTLKVGFAFPGSEGEYTYQGNTYPGGQLHKWRKRFHPLKDGLTQEYTLAFNADSYTDFQKFYSTEWQIAFDKLNPAVNYQDIDLVRETMLSVLPDLAVVKVGKTGLSNWYDATDPSDKLIDNKAVFGFTGKNIEAAYYLLYNAEEHPNQCSIDYRKIAGEIISSFIDLNVNPPDGEGYYFEDGCPALAIPAHNHVYLRSYGDAMKILAKAYIFEKENGRNHIEWLQWMSDFGIWVLDEQYENGGFPRAWKPGSGEVSVKSPASSYNLVPFLCEMHTILEDDKWLESAVKVGDFIWEAGQKSGRFIGGTIDNPDVLDKEAGTLSLEAYLSLYKVTGDDKWLYRAEIAAMFAETWLYIWDVPMVEGDPQNEWSDNVSTIGLQLISTGHSLVDNYMAFDVDEFAKLYKYTGNEHYLKIAKILLHNTKGMISLPGRENQYRAPGWIQEHWSLAPPRGKGLHPGWLPWVTTSNLNGICETEIFDRDLFEELKN